MFSNHRDITSYLRLRSLVTVVMMLWRKETNKPGALYVDIFAQKSRQWLNACYSLSDGSVPQKNDTMAEAYRKVGNGLFGEQKYFDAMKQYNDSMRNAEKGSEHISLAYANRSACFIHFKMYNECLVDIELAKATGYPDHLMPKLDRRKAECLERIAEAGGATASNDFGLKLSLDSDEKFPCMANVLKFERTADGEYAIYATEDIDVGKTIVVEDSFSTYLYQQPGWRCNICLKENTNLVPCDKCTIAMFCKDTCTGHYLHKSECGILFTKENSFNGVLMHDVRTILMAINMFSNADELMEFVEQTVASDRNELPDNLLDEKSKYRAFLKLPTHLKFVGMDNFTALTVCINKTVLDIPQVQSMFKSEKHRRFLMHLITLHAMISDENSIRASTIVQNEREELYSQTAIMKRFFKHSCAPNVFYANHDGKTAYMTIRPVKKGDQLHSFAANILQEPKQKRQQMLSKFKNLTRCKCARCEGEAATSEQRRTLAADPDYRKISSISIAERYDNKQLHALINQCVAFLNKHGGISWCLELGNVVVVYTGLLRHRLAGQINYITPSHMN